MRIQLPFALLAAIVFACTMLASPAQAQRVFVSATGSDGNPCSFASPCRSFQHAHDTAPAGGEIDVLDPGGYGALTITKAISIQGHGFSGISVNSAATGITINASTSDAVNLNGLLIDGAGVGYAGITFTTGKALTVSNSVARNLTFSGLNVTNNSTASLTVSNSYFTDNAENGLVIQPAGSPNITAAIDHSVFSDNGFAGLNVLGQGSTGILNVTVTDSVASNNSTGTGFIVQTASGKSVSNLALTRVTVNGNLYGITSIGGATLWLAQSTLMQNTNGYFIAGGVINTYGNSFLAANGTNTGSLSYAAPE
jgi:hypothetical protein